MRVTLDIDDDILAYAMGTAALTHSTAGKVLGNLVRRALHPREAGSETFNGFRLVRPIPEDDQVRVTPEMVEGLLIETE